MADPQPTVSQMVREAVAALGGSTTNAAVRDWILQKYPGTNTGTIHCQIMGATVNHSCRIYYCADRRPRLANSPTLDPFYRPAQGQIEAYAPAKHGQWEIYESESGKLKVRLAVEDVGDLDDAEHAHAFAAEDHLRDYLAQHLEQVEAGLQLYIDDNDVTGVEFVIPVGRIDILATDKNDDLVVIELKVARGPDSASGQILRYKNWVKKHLANGRKVRGIIIAQHISDKIRYAICEDPDVCALEYKIQLKISPVAKL